MSNLQSIYLLKYLQHSQCCTLDAVFEAVPWLYTPHTILTQTNFPLTLKLPSLYGQNETKPESKKQQLNVSIQIVNVVSRPLFFQLETQETRICLHWCTNQRFVIQVLHLTSISHLPPYYKTHTTSIEFLCLSTNLEKRKKRLKYA